MQHKQKCWKCGGEGVVDADKAKLSPSQARNKKSYYGGPICPACNGRGHIFIGKGKK